jgi:hypothetical protein
MGKWREHSRGPMRRSWLASNGYEASEDMMLLASSSYR